MRTTPTLLSSASSPPACGFYPRAQKRRSPVCKITIFVLKQKSISYNNIIKISDLLLYCAIITILSYYQSITVKPLIKPLGYIDLTNYYNYMYQMKLYCSVITTCTTDSIYSTTSQLHLVVVGVTKSYMQKRLGMILLANFLDNSVPWLCYWLSSEIPYYYMSGLVTGVPHQ